MLKQIKFIGFDKKCEYCGNYYASNYIEFHIRERCLKSPLNKRIKSQTISPKQPLTSAQNPSFPKNNPFSVTPPKSTSQNKNLSCPYCSMPISRNKYQRHINIKCPMRHQYSNFKVQLKSRLPSKKRLIRDSDSKEGFVPVERNKVRCSKCSHIYSKSESRCPECLKLDLRNSPLAKCLRCEKFFDKENYEKHLSKCFDVEVSCLGCKQPFTLLAFQAHEHKKIEIASTVRSLIQCEHCKCQLSSTKYERHLAHSCPQMNVKCQYCQETLTRLRLQQHISSKHIKTSVKRVKPTKEQIAAMMGKPTMNGTIRTSSIYIKALALRKNISPRKCRICGRIAMNNSGHCYTCGDK